MSPLWMSKGLLYIWLNEMEASKVRVMPICGVRKAIEKRGVGVGVGVGRGGWGGAQ